MLTQLTSRLASQLNDLTIQVVKEDWTLASSPLTSSPATMFPPRPANYTASSVTSPVVYPLPNTGVPTTKQTAILQQQQQREFPSQVAAPLTTVDSSTSGSNTSSVAQLMEGGHQFPVTSSTTIGVHTGHQHHMVDHTPHLV